MLVAKIRQFPKDGAFTPWQAYKHVVPPSLAATLGIQQVVDSSQPLDVPSPFLAIVAQGAITRRRIADQSLIDCLLLGVCTHESYRTRIPSRGAVSLYHQTFQEAHEEQQHIHASAYLQQHFTHCYAPCKYLQDGIGQHCMQGYHTRQPPAS